MKLRKVHAFADFVSDVAVVVVDLVLVIGKSVDALDEVVDFVAVDILVLDSFVGGNAAVTVFVVGVCGGCCPFLHRS